jgi:AraC-like DNA-binding protein
MVDSRAQFLQRSDSILRAGGLLRLIRADEAGHAGMPRDASLMEHARLIVALEGKVEFERRRGGHRVVEPLAPREGLFVVPGRWVRARAWEPYTSMGIVFYRDMTRFYLMQGKPARDGHPGSPVETHVVPAGLSEDGRALVRLLTAPAPHGAERFFRNVAECLLTLSRELLAGPAVGLEGGKARSSWQAACDFVMENLHRPLTRKEVARHLGMHPNHVSRLFAQFGQAGFSEYLTARRLERARLLLADPRMHVSEVARLSGFASASYFARVHRARTGRPPTVERSLL